MKQWVVVACRAEAKIFGRQGRGEELQWIKTLSNKKGRRKEREFDTGQAGMSFAKFSAGAGPHKLEGKHSHSEIVAQHFAQQIAKFIHKSFDEKQFKELTVLAGAHFLGLLKIELKELDSFLKINFIPKNLEKAQADVIAQALE